MLYKTQYLEVFSSHIQYNHRPTCAPDCRSSNCPCPMGLFRRLGSVDDLSGLNTDTVAAHFVSHMRYFLSFTHRSCVTSINCNAFCSFITFKVGAREYKIMSTPHVFSGLLTLRSWVLDSACAFPFTFNPPTTTF
jgi:hypothetical protein